MGAVFFLIMVNTLITRKECNLIDCVVIGLSDSIHLVGNIFCLMKFVYQQYGEQSECKTINAVRSDCVSTYSCAMSALVSIDFEYRDVNRCQNELWVVYVTTDMALDTSTCASTNQVAARHLEPSQ